MATPVPDGPMARQPEAKSRIRIVPASETAHLAAVAELAGVIWRACYPGIISLEQIDYMLAKMYDLEVLRAETSRQGIHYGRLLEGENLIGFASYGPWLSADEYKLHKLYLHPDRQGQGLGSVLLNHCEREALRLGARRLRLNVNKRNTRAIRAYQRNGFQIMEAVVEDIGGGFVMDDYIMAKPLGQ